MTRNQKIVLISTAAVVAALPTIALARAIKENVDTPLEKIKRITDKVKKTTE